ncbi:MAG: hypothetical protein GF355_09340 [Candidatus Eisenbacteria bacterium]|nr:hypothetical protein [Candidatus Eisenbacteria bacterium]
MWLLTLGPVRFVYRCKDRAGLYVALLLAVHWLWYGGVYHLGYFRSVNPAATIFGIFFVLKGGLFLWLAASRRLTFKSSSSIWSWIGTGLVVYVLAYPFLGHLAELRYLRLPTFGVPCPAAILTAGVLLIVPRRAARWSSIITILWTAIGGSAAFVLGICAHLALPLAGILLLVYVLTPA